MRGCVCAYLLIPPLGSQNFAVALEHSRARSAEAKDRELPQDHCHAARQGPAAQGGRGVGPADRGAGEADQAQRQAPVGQLLDLREVGPQGCRHREAQQGGGEEGTGKIF